MAVVAVVVVLGGFSRTMARAAINCSAKGRAVRIHERHLKIAGI